MKKGNTWSIELNEIMSKFIENANKRGNKNLWILFKKCLALKLYTFHMKTTSC